MKGIINISEVSRVLTGSRYKIRDLKPVSLSDKNFTALVELLEFQKKWLENYDQKPIIIKKKNHVK